VVVVAAPDQEALQMLEILVVLVEEDMALRHLHLVVLEHNLHKMAVLHLHYFNMEIQDFQDLDLKQEGVVVRDHLEDHLLQMIQEPKLVELVF
jgi:hypothetical protein